jgi:hypothetical protein
MTDSNAGLHYGPILLQAGISRLNALAFAFTSFITIGLMIFINFGTT